MSKPVYGSPTAATSLSTRLVPQAVLDHPGAACCHEGAVKRALHPPPLALNCLNPEPDGRPLSFQTVSFLRRPAPVSDSAVPPTATTDGSEAGASASSGAARPEAMSSQFR